MQDECNEVVGSEGTEGAMEDPGVRSRFLPLRSSVLGSPWFLSTAVFIIVFDLLTKAWAWSFVPEHGTLIRVIPTEQPRQVYPVIDGFFYIARAENPGTVWGLFQEFTAGLTILRVGMVLFLLAFAAMLARSQRAALVGLAFVLGGALGNLYDNLVPSEGVQIAGAVRDFLDFYLPVPWLEHPYHYPTFNIADASILVGALLLFLGLGEKKAVKSEPPEAPARHEPRRDDA